MPTLILPPRYTPDSILLWRTAVNLNWEVERLQSWQISSERCKSFIEPFIYGEPLFAKTIAEKLSIALIDPPLNWLTTLSDSYLKRKVEFMTFADVDRVTKTSFIKPAAEKYFPAKVYDFGQQVTELALAPDIPILVSEPVQWEIEFRCFVSDLSVKGISSYWCSGASTKQEDGSWQATATEYEEAKQFCLEVINSPQVAIPDAVVIDVGKIVGKGWAVIEANSAYSSGIYGCDPLAVIKVIKRANINNARSTFNSEFPH